jgi:hypothetical protein
MSRFQFSHKLAYSLKDMIPSLYRENLVLYQLIRMIFLFFSFATQKIGFIVLLMWMFSYKTRTS